MAEIDDEIKKVKEEIANLQEGISKESELKMLKKRLGQLRFRKEHPKLLRFTMGSEQGVKRMFKVIGSGIKKAGTALEKSDAYIEREKQKERELSKNKPKKQRSAIDEASFGID